jgi:hypothetical protein
VQLTAIRKRPIASTSRPDMHLASHTEVVSLQRPLGVSYAGATTAISPYSLVANRSRRAVQGRIYPFAEPSGIARNLREADPWTIRFFARLHAGYSFVASLLFKRAHAVARPFKNCETLMLAPPPRRATRPTPQFLSRFIRTRARRRSASVLGSCASSVGVFEFFSLLGSAGCVSSAV